MRVALVFFGSVAGEAGAGLSLPQPLKMGAVLTDLLLPTFRWRLVSNLVWHRAIGRDKASGRGRGRTADLPAAGGT